MVTAQAINQVGGVGTRAPRVRTADASWMRPYRYLISHKGHKA